jgi:hypothetical protein
MAIPEARTTAAFYVDEYGVSIISAKIPCGGRDIACSSQESFTSALHSDTQGAELNLELPLH